MALGEDKHGCRDLGACNLPAIRKILLAALEKAETRKKHSKKTKRLLACADPEFREEALKFPIARRTL